jgi:hypothetical protein
VVAIGKGIRDRGYLDSALHGGLRTIGRRCHAHLVSPGGLSWADLGTDQLTDRYAEWLTITTLTDPGVELAELAARWPRS